MPRLGREFYLDEDVVHVAKRLLGKVLVTHLNGVITAGLICETEAYAGVKDRASHAFGDRRTKRTETMYLRGGHAYVYLCYGIHELFNVVTHSEEIPHAVLIRGVLPLEGVEIMDVRRGGKKKHTGIGPGNVSKCLGITRELNGEDLVVSNRIWIEDRGIVVHENETLAGPRIGVDYAGDDALLHYRFVWNKKP